MQGKRGGRRTREQKPERVSDAKLSAEGVSGKVSEMILQFAQPLLQLEPDGPPDIKAVRNVMMLATVCWNLPVVEAGKGPDGPRIRKMFDEAMASVPESIRRVLLGLLDDRRTKFAAVPFLVIVSVEGSLDRLRIVAEARMP